jgi:two-component sensor histidine kinase/CHASE1-domain containing sensor protein
MLNISRLLSLLILISSIAAAAATYYFSYRDDEEQAATLSAQLTSRLDDQLTVLEGVRALYFTHKVDGGEHIRAYLRAIHTHARSTGIQGIGIVAATTPAQESDRLALIRKNYGPDARLWPTSSGKLTYPITFIEPYDTLNSGALGFDMYSETIRRRAIQRAWTTGQASASNIVQLIQNGVADDPQPAFLLFLPITDPQNPQPLVQSASPQNSPQDQPLEALAYAPIRIRDLMNALIAPSLSGLSGVQVYAGTDSAAPLVYSHGEIKFGAHETSIRIADKKWRMIVSYQTDFNQYGRPLLVLLFGIATAALVLRVFSDQRRRINAYRHLADEKARNAEDRELIIGEMAHRLKNAFARVGALSRITIRESQSLAEYEERFDGRLRALADTKQMMLSGGIATLNLAGLIQREMQMAGWDKEQLHAISGPPVHLNEDGAQALGLIIHELVTNSIKYGALSGTGELSVQWERQKRSIRLSWLEHGLSATPIIDQESFGTHFIRSLIQRQLRGDWQRTAEKRQLHVVITWPEESQPSGEASPTV